MLARHGGLVVAILVNAVLAAGLDPVQHVDPLIGTDEMGHTFPGATVPFGLVQLTPLTEVAPYSFGEGYNPEAYRYCAGYQYDDPTIVGFVHTAFNGIGDYRRLGFVPADRQTNAASKTLEYAFDDWTIARMAEALGEGPIREEFDRRSTSWRNLFDRPSGFLRARNAAGSFPQGFDPMSTHGQGYIEGNAWNYSLFVPHDVDALARLVGGPARLVEWLDSLFEMEVDDASISATEDVTRAGMIGNYVHGNEPSHHVPYMYCHLGQPWKTQARVRQVMREMYRPAADGLCGNDDVGQMSAWYVFSALGFYPVTPGSGQYVLGSPAVERAELDLGNGRTLVVVAENQSPDTVYVDRVTLDGVPLDRSFVTHDELVADGELRFVMGRTPNRQRATGPAAAPYSASRVPATGSARSQGAAAGK